MKKALRARLAFLSAGAAGLSGTAFAAVPADISTSITDMKTDGVEMATMVLVAIIAVSAILFLKKAIGR